MQAENRNTLSAVGLALVPCMASPDHVKDEQYKDRITTPAQQANFRESDAADDLEPFCEYKLSCLLSHNVAIE